jgi:hypothetical protein
MKIIGTVGKEDLLIEVTKDEIANLTGLYSTTSSDFDRNDLVVGTTINISEIYRKHILINSFLNKSDYDKARRKLQEMLDAITPIENLIIKATGK